MQSPQAASAGPRPNLPGLSGPDRPDQVVERLLRSRHSCRGFRPDPVPRPVVERILSLAQRTASWCNSQPWQVIVTSGSGTEAFRRALSAHAQANEAVPDIAFPAAYEGVYQARRRVCGFQLYESVGVARGDRVASARQSLENFRLFGAPHVAIISTERALGTYGAVDCGGYVSTFMLAAESLGVSTIAQAALAGHSAFIRDHFALPADRLVVCGISFGYEDEAHRANAFRTDRASLEEAVTFVGECGPARPA